MRSVAALAGHRVRARLRSPGALVLGGLATLALGALALGSPEGAESGAVSLASALLGVVVVAGLVAASSGATLPEDRASGRAEWLATLRPSPAAQRLSVALGGGALAALVATAGAALVGALLVASGRPVPTTDARPLPVDRHVGDALATIGLPDGAASGRVVEIDVLPLVLDVSEAPPPTIPVRVSWEGADAPSATVEAVPFRGSHRLFAPRGAGRLRVDAPLDAPVVPRVVAARLVGRPRSFVGNVLLAGLLVGLGVALAVPFAVLVSRGTSAPTASLAAAVAVLVGIVRGPLLSFADDLAVGASSGAATLAAGVLRGAALLAPDLSAVRLVEEASFGRALPPGAFAALVPAALHAGVCSLLLAVPSRRSRVP